jgi:non-homologous end joining protein Ku
MTAKMTKVETFVPDPAVNQIVDDISNYLSPGNESQNV